MVDNGEQYPLVNIQKTMERSTIFNGKINYQWSIFNSYVKLPEGIWLIMSTPDFAKPWFINWGGYSYNSHDLILKWYPPN